MAQNEYNGDGSVRKKEPPKHEQSMGAGAGAGERMLNPRTGPARLFKRCPNGYRWIGGHCHTFGFHDHMLVHQHGHFRPAKQPMVRQKPSNGGY
jgi:hypothetical protein